MSSFKSIEREPKWQVGPNWNISVNDMGCLVLNVDSVFIADVDCNSDTYPCRSKTEWLEYFRKIEQTIGYTFVVYETRNGFRVFVTNTLIPPTGLEAFSLLNILYSDVFYAICCKNQNCYRARLTPKPLRMKESYDNLETYLQNSKRYAVCIPVTDRKTVSCLPEVEQLLIMHDSYVLHDGADLA